MGFYYITLGKGVIMPTKRFLKKYAKEILKVVKKTQSDNPDDIFDEVVKKKFGEKYSVSPLGHDAFKSRHNIMDVFRDSENYQSLEIINKWRKKEYTLSEELADLAFFGCGDLMFIGVFRDIEGGDEFEYRVETPQLLYGLAAFLPDLVRYYSELIHEDVTDLAKTGQEPRIWTFASDCHCCT